MTKILQLYMGLSWTKLFKDLLKFSFSFLYFLPYVRLSYGPVQVSSLFDFSRYLKRYFENAIIFLITYVIVWHYGEKKFSIWVYVRFNLI